MADRQYQELQAAPGTYFSASQPNPATVQQQDIFQTPQPSGRINQFQRPSNSPLRSGVQMQNLHPRRTVPDDASSLILFTSTYLSLAKATLMHLQVQKRLCKAASSTITVSPGASGSADILTAIAGCVVTFRGREHVTGKLFLLWAV